MEESLARKWMKEKKRLNENPPASYMLFFLNSNYIEIKKL